MKRFITLSALVLAMTGLALACGPWARPMYYVFSAYNRQQLGDTFMPRLERFWIDYTGDNTAGYAMQSLAYVDMEHFEESTNCIVRKALDSGDKEMEDYLRVLVAYMQLSKDLDDDNWAYPTKGQQANRNMRMQYLHDRAKSYSGTRLLPQYRLMAMRTLMGKGDTQGIINYWNKAESGLKPSVYKDLMRNIYAGALLRTGKKKEACDIYAEQGDMLSLKWIMRDNRDLNGIRSEYDRDPNAPTLVYLVQDFVNRGNATLRAQYEYDWDNPAYIAASQQEMRQFIAFATQVVREGKTSVPALWQSAAGLLTCNLGDTQQGLDMLDKALKLRGTQRMLDNARVCRWVASAANADGSKKYQDYFLDELKWVQTVEKREIEQYSNYYNNYGFASNHYTEVMQNMMYDIMPVKARQWGNSNLSTALQGWMYQHERLIAGNDLGEDYWVSGDYRCALDSLTSTEMVAYRDYLTAGKRATTALERYLNTGTSPNMTTDYFYDRIGTKLIREGVRGRHTLFGESARELLRHPGHLLLYGQARYGAAPLVQAPGGVPRRVVGRVRRGTHAGEHKPKTRLLPQGALLSACDCASCRCGHHRRRGSLSARLAALPGQLQGRVLVHQPLRAELGRRMLLSERERLRGLGCPAARRGRHNAQQRLRAAPGHPLRPCICAQRNTLHHPYLGCRLQPARDEEHLQPRVLHDERPGQFLPHQQSPVGKLHHSMRHPQAVHPRQLHRPVGRLSGEVQQRLRIERHAFLRFARGVAPRASHGVGFWGL